MKIFKERKLNRLKGYEYSSDGYYFITICIKNDQKFLGKIKKGKMILNEYGEIVKNQWVNLPNHYQNCILDEFIIMPNHLHGIVIIRNGFVGNGLKPFPTATTMTKKHGLSEMIRGFKTFASKMINIKYGQKIFAWQKSFYDHIIRNEKSLYNIRKYIQNNPIKWELSVSNNNNIKYKIL